MRGGTKRESRRWHNVCMYLKTKLLLSIRISFAVLQSFVSAGLLLWCWLTQFHSIPRQLELLGVKLAECSAGLKAL
jgi:hypothetical protein